MRYWLTLTDESPAGGLRASIFAGILLCFASQSFAAVRISAIFNNNKLPGDQGSKDGSYELLSSSFSLGQTVSKTAGTEKTGLQAGKVIPPFPSGGLFLVQLHAYKKDCMHFNQCIQSAFRLYTHIRLAPRLGATYIYGP